MNRDDESRFLAWLNRESVESEIPSTEIGREHHRCEARSPDFDPEEIANLGKEELDPLNSEQSSLDAQFNEQEELLTHPDSQSNHLGEIPTVQHRFEALIKRRLQTEIQKAPPLFPWETEVRDYSTDTFDELVTVGVPSRLWTTQLKNLQLPVALPETLLKSLLARCQEVVNASVREGEKWVRAVEELFPDRSSELYELAGMVAMGPVRFGGGEQESHPLAYEVATPKQQMVLSLMAAREILKTLKLRVSASEPRSTREWLTEAGVLTLEAEYQPDRWLGKLRVQVHLPEGGSLQFKGAGALATAQRTDAGSLSVELFDVQPQQTYTLEVTLDDREHSPFTFVICPSA
ncbi:hypothetical protein IQ235_11370 [Oscillatoriales cyanobacterium LEGE 11467]|uniref:PatU n=1 Tax=Zarconia navalis LEGE 11467 TaxID=1828826 RepID=A0A928ZA47_9CYAN|nr:hypothetical protein [Zarconia navalis]MBE9041381.1 hypothetical protein [Zarconia navalis LEGE 11467]